MKTYFLLLLLLLPLCAVGQVSGDTVTVWRYAELKYLLSGSSSKATAEVDYGDAVKGWFRGVELLEDERGKAIKFKSAVDALNWMSSRGWELVVSYMTKTDPALGLGSSLEYIHFMMRRLEPRRRE